MPASLRLHRTLIPPEPHDVHPVTLSDGATIVLRRHGNPEGPRVALSHGNGMAIEAYYPFWRLMLADYDVILFDSRNHGRNPVDGAANHTWDRFCDDFERLRQAIDARWGARRTAGIFHSLASIAALMQTRLYGERWSPLILVDPPIFPPPGHALEEDQRRHMREMDAIAKRRPDRFDDPEDLAAVLRKRRAFARWADGAHELYALETLRREGDGWTLACPKELEALTFATNIDPSIWPEVGAMPGDIAVIGADTTLPEAGTPAFLGQALAHEQGIAYAMIPDSTHFLQIEHPDLAWDAAEGLLQRFGHAA